MTDNPAEPGDRQRVERTLHNMEHNKSRKRRPSETEHAVKPE